MPGLQTSPFLHKHHLVLIGPSYGCQGRVVLHMPCGLLSSFFLMYFIIDPTSRSSIPTVGPYSLTNWMNTQCWQLGIGEILVPCCPQTVWSGGPIDACMAPSACWLINSHRLESRKASLTLSSSDMLEFGQEIRTKGDASRSSLFRSPPPDSRELLQTVLGGSV